MAAPRESATLEIEKLTPAAIAAYLNNAVHTEDGISRLQMENQLAVPGDGYRL